MNILEAVDTLSSLAEIDADENKRFLWLDPKQIEKNRDKVQKTFDVLSQYLHHLSERETSELSNPKTQQGLKAVMKLAKEAASKSTALFQEVAKEVTPQTKFEQIERFYLTKIVTKWGVEGERQVTTHEPVLKDLESVRTDKDYELFFIHQEDGLPYFNSDLLRHLELVGRFDESIEKEKNPHETLDALWGVEVSMLSKTLLKEASIQVVEFYKDALKFRQKSGIAFLNQALIALTMSHRIAPHSSKSAQSYFSDFLMFLRSALLSNDYAHWQKTSIDKLAPLMQAAVRLISKLLGSLYLRLPDRVKHTDWMRSFAPGKMASSLAELSDWDSRLRHELALYPSGPLLKILKMFEEGREGQGFDSIQQDNIPEDLFSIEADDFHVSFLRLPSPTYQLRMTKAEIDPEFEGYLRFLRPRKQLIFDFQTPKSWKDEARCRALNELSKRAEYESLLIVVPISKSDEVYTQTGEELTHDEAHALIDLLAHRLPGYDLKGLSHFVHDQFFQKKQLLTREERLNFVEIFDFFAELKMIELEKPDAVSFTCKDGVDISPTSAAFFFAALKLLTEPLTFDDTFNHFLSILYSPALLIRHRAPDPKRVHRMIMALTHFANAIQDGHVRESLLAKCSLFFPELILHRIRMGDVA